MDTSSNAGTAPYHKWTGMERYFCVTKVSKLDAMAAAFYGHRRARLALFWGFAVRRRAGCAFFSALRIARAWLGPRRDRVRRRLGPSGP
jgi:hypothetical protein